MSKNNSQKEMELRKLKDERRGESISRVNLEKGYSSDYKQVEQRFFDGVLRGVKKKLEFANLGLVPMNEAIDAMNQYQKVGYEPRSGTPCESLDDAFRWTTSIVTNTAVTWDEKEDCMVKTATAIGLDSRRLESLSHGNDPDEVRPMQSAVKCVWGETPWYWLQYQLLMAEMQMRFDHNHCFDFEEIQWKKWIEDRFKVWVGEEKGDESNVDSIHNKAFQEYYAQQEQGAKDALLDVMSEPFEMIDDIVNVWFKDFEEEVSCYTYLSFLGQDFFFTTISLGVQILVPLVLLSSSLKDLRHQIRCDQQDYDELDDNHQCEELGIYSDDSTIMCTQRSDGALGRLMLIGVLFYYAVTVVPDQLNRFYTIYGDSEDTISRMNSLRKYVYDQDEDGLITSKIGYRLDMSMNTTYHCLLYLLTLFMLYTYNDPEEIILNALAIEFIKDIDEKITDNNSYDTDYRFLKAGAVEMVLRRYLNLHDLRARLRMNDGICTPTESSGGDETNPSTVSRTSVSRAELLLNRNDREASQFAVDEAMLYTRQPKEHQYAIYTWLERATRRRRRTMNKETKEAYSKVFGEGAQVKDNGGITDCFLWIIRWIMPLATAPAIFDKFNEFRKPRLEERWNDLIYGRLPWLSLEKTKERKEKAQNIGQLKDWDVIIAESKKQDKEDYRTFSELRRLSVYNESKVSYWASEIRKALFLTDLPTHISRACSADYTFTERISRVLFFIVAAVFNSVSVIIQLAFPVIFLVAMIYIPYCY